MKYRSCTPSPTPTLKDQHPQEAVGLDRSSNLTAYTVLDKAGR
jgi:hypothetical protein